MAKRLVEPHLLARDWMWAEGGKSVRVFQSAAFKPFVADVQRIKMCFCFLEKTNLYRILFIIK